MKKCLSIDKREYNVDIFENISSDSEHIHIIIPSFMPTHTGVRMTEVCIDSIRKYTSVPYTIWLVDNNSPDKYRTKFLARKDINTVFLNTVPVETLHFFDKIILSKPLKNTYPGRKRRYKHGSFSKALCFEIGLQLIPSETKYVFVMDSDCLVFKDSWLSYILSKIDDKTKIAGFMHDRLRVNAVYSNGYIFDFQLFQKLNIDMFPNIKQKRNPSLPEYDAGDLTSIVFREHGYKEWSCNNTYNTPELISKIDSPLSNIYSDRCFDDDWNVVYAHLGRGLSKSEGKYKQKGKTSAEKWIEFAEMHVLK